MKFFRKPYRYAIVFLIGLFLFTGYVLLDTFLIPEKGIKVESPKKIVVEKNDAPEVPIEFIDNDIVYQDNSVRIEIINKKEYDSNIYIADITIKDIKFLKTAFAKDTFGRNITETVSTQAKNHEALLAINGDFYGFRSHGMVLRNGILYRSNSDETDNALIIYSDGNFEVIKELDHSIDDIIKRGVWQILSFGPGIVFDGENIVSLNGTQNKFTIKNPRTAIGIIDSLHYIFLVADGRTSISYGLTLYEVADVMKNYGCKIAYNLDGGGSSAIYFNGKIINKPTSGGTIGERKVSDIVYIGY